MRVRHINTSRTFPALPDGRQPEKIRCNELWLALKALAIPNIDASMGKRDLLDAYLGHVERVAADLRAENIVRCVGPLPEAVAAKAVELIARNAANAA